MAEIDALVDMDDFVARGFFSNNGTFEFLHRDEIPDVTGIGHTANSYAVFKVGHGISVNPYEYKITEASDYDDCPWW